MKPQSKKQRKPKRPNKQKPLYLEDAWKNRNGQPLENTSTKLFLVSSNMTNVMVCMYASRVNSVNQDDLELVS